MLPPLPSALSAPAAAWVDDLEQTEAIVAAGTAEWCEFQVPTATSRARGCWVTLHAPEPGSEEEREAERWWPQGRACQPWSVGVWLEEADLSADEGKKWK